MSDDGWPRGQDCDDDDTDEDTPEIINIKRRVYQALRSIDSKGDFACFRGLNGILDPKLHINGLDRVVKLPLSPDDTNAIIDVCHRSPFGKGEETLVDTSVRKCWELNTTEFDIKAPGWANYMKKIVADVGKGLGVADKVSSIRADPYKLLLYEKDAFFLSHQDSPKADGMFATLVVCLPTEHEGGEIVLNHQGKSMQFKTSTTSMAGFSYAAWYSDVFHEIKPITGGHRLVLTYNLILEGTDNVPSAPSSESRALRNALKFWEPRAEDEGLYLLLYKLSHMYTDSSLSFQSMKGSDRPQVYPCIAESLVSQEYATVKKALNYIFLKARDYPTKQVLVATDLVSACIAIPDERRPSEWADLLSWREQKLAGLLPRLRNGSRDELDSIVRILTLYPTIEKLQE
ncbi:Fe2OG dioxygenase domain-containing protein [Trichophyton interdigitale]|uniref:Fe2OG dioxygenase domain-containing protein n=1 Tax=Trichophyton interdigitale TaxID=101480 RepID=A0A9P4YIP8_9EURO|nr:Fe2OG dioxygenase domain-containing protein [Trichophyton interdigitale]KAF3896341.1 Fe2OG dioxygenase domain-containing protein [Trichophyton interdigitale]KAG8209147.1 Fe2OG dioxygenase domain-containing protein [Trichophyton interdigitale]